MGIRLFCLLMTHAIVMIVLARIKMDTSITPSKTKLPIELIHNGISSLVIASIRPPTFRTRQIDPKSAKKVLYTHKSMSAMLSTIPEVNEDPRDDGLDDVDGPIKGAVDEFLSYDSLLKQGLLSGIAAVAPLPLEKKWTLYMLPATMRWAENSYMRQGTFDSLQGFCVLFNTVFYERFDADNRPILDSFKADHMFFIMKDDMFPSWESQPDGGVWTFVVPKKDVESAWREIVFSLIGGTTNSTHINGLQITSKGRGLFQIRVWTDHGRGDSLEKETMPTLTTCKLSYPPSFRSWQESK